jgi:hypothetical protein
MEVGVLVGGEDTTHDAAAEAVSTPNDGRSERHADGSARFDLAATQRHPRRAQRRQRGW